jgi:hypothetical protein
MVMAHDMMNMMLKMRDESADEKNHDMTISTSA